MLTLHIIGQSDEGPRVSIGILNPHPPAAKAHGRGIELFDFGEGGLKTVDQSQVLSVGIGDPAAVTFAPDLHVVDMAVPMAANQRGKVVRIPTRRKRAPVSDTFVSGYGTYAAPMAAFWRENGVGPQPLLAAGVFSLSSIQTPIVTALRLFGLLTPYVVDDYLPPVNVLRGIVQLAGAGLDSAKTGRPRWYVEYDGYRETLVAAMDLGLRDDQLRYAMSVETPMPRGLGLAKLSFTLALVGQNLGCLDARIIKWAFSPKNAERFNRTASRKRKDDTVSPTSYRTYRVAELRILERDSPFYDPRDPVALARSQWKLWESLGPEDDQTHSHEELFEAVVDDRLDEL